MRSLEDPRFKKRLDELSTHSDLIWFIALNVGLGFTLIAAYLSPGKFWAYAGLFIRASLYLWSGDALRGRGGETLRRLFALGMVAGIFELLVDWGLIHWVTNGRLIYLTGNDVILLGSPVWMPLAWACVIVELGYPALRLYAILRRPIVATLITAIGAGVTVGFYEYFAYRAQWWKYERANAMLGDFCALYIPLGEFLMFLAILPIGARAIADEERRSHAQSSVEHRLPPASPRDTRSPTYFWRLAGQSEGLRGTTRSPAVT
jgi:hypothetical protein